MDSYVERYLNITYLCLSLPFHFSFFYSDIPLNIICHIGLFYFSTKQWLTALSQRQLQFLISEVQFPYFLFAGKTVGDVNVRTSLILSYLYSTTAVYVASLERVAAPSWLKINYRCYFCPSGSMSVLLSGVPLPISLSSLIISFLCFIPFSSLAFLPYLSLCFFDFLYCLAFGLCSASNSSHSCKTSVLNTCKGSLLLW